MKKKMVCCILAIMLILSLSGVGVYAAGVNQINVPIGSSNEVTMIGTIEPTVMSVTMPSTVPFHMSRSVQGDNKVVSPRITVTNNSSIPITLDVVQTKVDLSKLRSTTWSNGQYVGENQIAIGLQLEVQENQQPTNFNQTKWLLENSSNPINIMSLNSYESSAMYVVGALGNAVPENDSFRVSPIFVVRQAS